MCVLGGLMVSRTEECCLSLGKAAWERSGSRDGGTKGKRKNKVEAGCVYELLDMERQT